MKKRNLLYALGGAMIAAGVATLLTANSVLFDDEFVPFSLKKHESVNLFHLGFLSIPCGWINL